MNKLTRFYQHKQIESGHIRAVRDVLTSTHNWGLSSARYELNYASQTYTLSKIDNVDGITKDAGQPVTVMTSFKSNGGRSITIDSRNLRRISIEVDNLNSPPSELLDTIEPALSLELLSEVPSNETISSAFVAHGFNDEGTKYANEVARFLSLIGIRSESGRAFSSSSVSGKVKKRLAKHDMFVGIASPQDDHTWITQEIATAAALNKHLFILKEDSVDLKTGILGDFEYIPFPKDQLSKAFIPILEGLYHLND